MGMNISDTRKKLVDRAAAQGLPSVSPPFKRYDHDICCNGNRYKPIGSSCCSCIHWLRESPAARWLLWYDATYNVYVKMKSDV